MHRPMVQARSIVQTMAPFAIDRGLILLIVWKILDASACNFKWHAHVGSVLLRIFGVLQLKGKKKRARRIYCAVYTDMYILQPLG